MIFNIKHKLNFSEADMLIEKYYEGLTTVEEEKQLRDFLSQPSLPERFEPEQAILGYFNHKKQKTHFSLLPTIRWASAAAVIALIIIGSQLFVIERQSNYAYIDGKKVTDVREIKSQALASLSDISSSTDEVAEGLKSINGNELIQQQLDVFSGLEK
jgi:hypothetical protein